MIFILKLKIKIIIETTEDGEFKLGDARNRIPLETWLIRSSFITRLKYQCDSLSLNIIEYLDL